MLPAGQVEQAPLYGIDGVYEVMQDWNNGSTGGLDVYEPAFQVRPGAGDHKLAAGAPGPVE